MPPFSARSSDELPQCGLTIQIGGQCASVVAPGEPDSYQTIDWLFRSDVHCKNNVFILFQKGPQVIAGSIQSVGRTMPF